MHGVDGNPADAEVLVEILVGGDVAAAALHAQFHVQLSALGHRGDVRFRLENLDVRVTLDILRAYDAGLVDAQVERLRVIDVQLQRNLLEVQDDVGGVFDHTGNRRELVEHAVDLHRRNGGAFNRREQDAPQRVANGGAETALERLRVEAAEPVGECFALEFETLGPLKTFPKHCVCPFANGRAAPASWPAGYVHQQPAPGLKSCGLMGASR